MWRAKSMPILFSVAQVVFAGQSMTVAICNLNQAADSVIEHAQTETSYVFRPMGVEIQWKECDQDLLIEDARVLLADFVVRVHPGGRIPKAGPVSQEMMGRAYMDTSGAGYMVDVYYGAIQHMTVQFPFVGNG